MRIMRDNQRNRESQFRPQNVARIIQIDAAEGSGRPPTRLNPEPPSTAHLYRTVHSLARVGHNIFSVDLV